MQAKAQISLAKLESLFLIYSGLMKFGVPTKCSKTFLPFVEFPDPISFQKIFFVKIKLNLSNLTNFEFLIIL